MQLAHRKHTDVGQNLEQVLQNMNTLNRSLESVIAVRPRNAACIPRSITTTLRTRFLKPTNLSHAQNLEEDARERHTDINCTKQVGNEFGQVEGLWSMFENVMAQQQQQQPQEEEGYTQAHTGAQEK